MDWGRDAFPFIKEYTKIACLLMGKQAIFV